MPTRCTLPGCKKPHHAHGMCVTHYRTWQRTGSPTAQRQPDCPTCQKIWRVLARPGRSTSQLLEKFADLFLLFETGSSYQLKNRDAQGREYDLDLRVEFDNE